MAVKVQPRASRTEIGSVVQNELQIRVTAPPVDSAANTALIRFLAELLDCPKSQVVILRGQNSRHKLVRLRGITRENVIARIGIV